VGVQRGLSLSLRKNTDGRSENRVLRRILGPKRVEETGVDDKTA
jgi:hypothetical protein